MKLLVGLLSLYTVSCGSVSSMLQPRICTPESRMFEAFPGEAPKSCRSAASGPELLSPNGMSVLRLRGGKVGGLKARDIWDKTEEELSQMEEELRTELMSLRVAQQVGGQPGRVNRIRMVRKSIARVLTVQTAKRRGEAFAKVAKDKYKPLDARPNRHWTKAMRQRLNKFERSRVTSKVKKCLLAKVWGAGVRPMRRIIGLNSPLDPVVLGYVNNLERTTAEFPRYRTGAHGRSTSTGHVPEHARAAMDKKKIAWVAELKRMRVHKDKVKKAKNASK